MSKPPFAAAERYRPTEQRESRIGPRPVAFGDVAREIESARRAAALFDRSDRGLVEVTGADRKSWLHNLVTNQVNNLDENTGNYAFACELKGRVVFDLNILVLPDRVWLDIDAGVIDDAIAHLDKRLIMEDARMTDRTAEFARLGVSGPHAAQIAADLGVTNLVAMPALSSAPVGDALLFRHDFAGVIGFELIVPRDAAAAWWDRLAEKAAPAGTAALDVLRIEAGIPWLGREIDEKTLPPETRQVERGISYHKGCYLGQEVLERMRSHGSLAKRLVLASIGAGPDGFSPPTLPAPLLLDGVEVGQLRSLVPQPTAEVRWVGLGYLRTKVAAPVTADLGETGVSVELRETPA